MQTPYPRLVLAVMILLVLVTRFQHLWIMNINWDEFQFLSRIHDFERGQLRSAFQSFHVHLFGWLVHVPGNEIERISATRVVVYILNLGSYLCLFLVGRHLLGRTGASFAVLAAISLPYVMRHGDSFRADPLIFFLFMLSITLLILRTPNRTEAAVAASALALATVISIKAVLYLPAILVIFLAKRLGPGIAGVFAGTGIAVYAGLYTLHASIVDTHTLAGTAVRVAGIGQRMLTETRLEYLGETLVADWGFWGSLGVGAILAAHQALRTSGESRRHAILLLGMALPLTSVLFYRNAFPYFYAAIVPTAALLCGLVVAKLESWQPHHPARSATLIIALTLPLAANALAYHLLNRQDAIAPQRQVIDAVHAMFPEPVPYIDRGGMIASFPKAGPFMSTFVLSGYRGRGIPVMADVVREAQPVFVLTNAPGLELGRPWDDEFSLAYRLLEEDHAFLEANYIHHWGPVWVAGKTLHTAGGEALDFDLAVPGRYTVESDNGVTLNGRYHRNGDVVDLVAGRYTIRSPDGGGPVTLRYGDHLHVPGEAPMEAPLFRGFR